MTTDEKLTLLIDYENTELYPELGEEHFKTILEFSKDGDSSVRSQAAFLLVNFKNSSSRNRLLKLAFDKDAFVRCEAYDSLGIFEDKAWRRF